VVFRYPAQADKNVTNDPFNTKPENTLSERQFAAEPLFRWISTNYPKTKVTVQDYSENLLKEDYMKDESWIFTTKDWFQPGHGIKHNNFGTNDHKAIADSGKRICALYGVDKPKVTLIDNEWYLYFLDVHANHTNQGFRHLVRVHSNPNHRTTYENIVKSIIYPDYDLQTWQTAKPTSSFYNEMDHWFHTNLQGTKIFSAWESGLQLLVDKIDKKYFYFQLDKPVGLQVNYSTFYHLGTSKIKTTDPVMPNRDYTNLKYKEQTALQNKKVKKVRI
jgi:hypothetical protein